MDKVLNAEHIQALNAFYNFLTFRQEPETADVIFILGGSSLAPVEQATELYKQGWATKIAFISTGGTFGGEKVWGMPENEKYREVLLAAGIPEEAILTEGKTTNTLMEAQEAIPFLRANGVDPKEVILVSRPFHQRRAFATFSKQHPSIKYINCPGEEPLDVRDRESRERLVKEADRLRDYSLKGDILAQPIPDELAEKLLLIRSEFE